MLPIVRSPARDILRTSAIVNGATGILTARNDRIPEFKPSGRRRIEVRDASVGQPLRGHVSGSHPNISGSFLGNVLRNKNDQKR